MSEPRTPSRPTPAASPRPDQAPSRRLPRAGVPGPRRRHPAARARRVVAGVSAVAFAGLVGAMAAGPASGTTATRRGTTATTTTGGASASTGSSSSSSSGSSSSSSSSGLAASAGSSSTSKPVTSSHAS